MLADTIAKLMLFPALMAFAASSDLLTMTISNRVSLILVGGFFVLALVIGMSAGGDPVACRRGRPWCWSWPSYSLRAAGSAAATPSLRPRPRCGSASITCWPIWSMPRCSAALLTLVLLQVRTMPLPSLLAGQQWAQRLHRKDAGVPYGIALAAAALVVYPDTIWMRAIAG